MGRHSELNSSARIIYVNKFYKNILIAQSDLTIKENIEAREYAFQKDKNVFSIRFPVIIQSSAEIWEIATTYLMYCLEEINDITGENLYNFANDLLDYLRFIEDKKTHFLDLPKFRNNRITTRYEYYLREQIENYDLRPNTAKRRINRVVDFYRTCIQQNFLTIDDFEGLPYEDRLKRITIITPDGYEREKEVNTHDHAITGSASHSDENLIYDDGALRPLDKREQLLYLEYLDKYGTRELQLLTYIALFTGARIQTICTLRVKNLKNMPLLADKETYKLEVGGTTGVDTKKRKPQNLLIPKKIKLLIDNYVESKEWVERAKKSFYGESDNNYIFLTKKSNPFYTSKKEIRDVKFKIDNDSYQGDFIVYKGNAVRKNLNDVLLKLCQDYPDFNTFRFHDLRATYGMNLVRKFEELGYSSSVIKNKVRIMMGHSSDKTTDLYLKYDFNKEERRRVQSKLENELFKYVN
nr:site-specific integrase [Acinetobacter lwoffii]